MSTVSDVIAAERSAILADWVNRVSGGFKGRSLPREVLLNSIPKLLDEIVIALQELDALEASKAISPDAAAGHGEQRLALGYSLDELGREYDALRQAMLAALDRRKVALNNSISAALHSAIDQAHRIGVQRYIELAQFRLQRRQSEFLARLTHDIRSPLATILTSAQLARRTTSELAAADHLARIERSARRLLLLVEAQLATEEALSGNLRVRLERVELAELAESIVDALRPRAEAKGLSLKNRVPVGLELITDRLLLGQVLQNLLDNAIKYTDHGYAQVTAQHQNGGVLLSIQDSGRGIPKEIAAVLFQMYERERASSGHGVGLAVVRTIVEALGGTVAVSSEIGRGTRFEVTFPARPHLAPNESAPAQ